MNRINFDIKIICTFNNFFYKTGFSNIKKMVGALLKRSGGAVLNNELSSKPTKPFNREDCKGVGGSIIKSFIVVMLIPYTKNH